MKTQIFTTPIKKEKVLPTLSTEGWVVDPIVKLDMLLSHLFESDSNLYYLNPSSSTDIHNLFKNYNNQPSVFVNELEAKLKYYLSVYYEQVDVLVYDQSEKENNEGSSVTIVAKISVLYGTKRYSTDKVVSFRDNKFLGVVEAYNEKGYNK